MAADHERGVLFLVAGPSGAGKDTLIRAASRDPRLVSAFLFPNRVVTRPSDPGIEDHRAVGAAEYERLARQGAFCLAWHAHGLRYGVPATVAADLACGRHVVVNVSRTVVDLARARFLPLRVLSITAPPDMLAARLAARGRETGHEIEARLARQALPGLEGADVIPIQNDGPVETGLEQFVGALLTTIDRIRR